VTVDVSGNVYVADSINSLIQIFTSSGTYLAQWGTRGTGNGQFDLPVSVAVRSGIRVYVADSFNNRIQEFAPLR
jgi:DNA-binding beta-propeller fold protein YncE